MDITAAYIPFIIVTEAEADFEFLCYTAVKNRKILPSLNGAVWKWSKNMNSIEERKVSDSIVETVHTVRPNHMNAAGRLFGGMLMQWLDEVAGLVAKRHTRSNIITASVDNLHFMHGAYQGEMVVIIGRVTYVGNTSLEVRVDTYVEHLEDGMRHPINRAYFTMVALDENDKPTRVPGLILETESEKAEWEAGKKRREIRMMRKKEGF